LFRVITLSNTHSVELLWTSDQPDAENSTWQQTTFTRHRQPCPIGIQNLNTSKQAAVDPHLRSHSHRDRLLQTWVWSCSKAVYKPVWH